MNTFLQLKHMIIDGQDVIVPDISEWLILKHDPKVNGQSFGGTDSSDKWIQYHIDFISSHPEFILALRAVGTMGLAPMLLISINDKWRRVHVENSTCKVCGWLGTVATPVVSELYYGVPDEWRVLKASWQIPIAHCPNCSNELPKDRHPIWVEPLDIDRV